MQTALKPKKSTITPQQPSNVDPQDKVTLIAFYVMMGSLVAALLYFAAMPFFF